MASNSTGPYKISHGIKFVPADLYDRALEALSALESIVPRELRDKTVLTPIETEAIVERHGLTPTSEVCQAFRLGVQHGRTMRCQCDGAACKCQP